MINTTNTVTIDGEVINKGEFYRLFQLDSNDRFNQWVLRPLAIVATLGIATAVFFASAFLLMLSLALFPLLAILFWAVKMKLKRDMEKVDGVVTTTSADDEFNADVHTAS